MNVLELNREQLLKILDHVDCLECPLRNTCEEGDVPICSRLAFDRPRAVSTKKEPMIIPGMKIKHKTWKGDFIVIRQKAGVNLLSDKCSTLFYDEEFSDRVSFCDALREDGFDLSDLL